MHFHLICFSFIHSILFSDCIEVTNSVYELHKQHVPDAVHTILKQLVQNFAIPVKSLYHKILIHHEPEMNYH